ncbi:MAG: hypothetical protein ABEJ99_01450 [Candidatus Nanohaloarchaea archaeon]
MFFQLFLSAFAFFISIVSIALIYLSMEDVRDSHVPAEYLNVFALAGLAVFSGARVYSLATGGSLGFSLLQDLMVAYVGLFLFAAVWQNKEAWGYDSGLDN